MGDKFYTFSERYAIIKYIIENIKVKNMKYNELISKFENTTAVSQEIKKYINIQFFDKKFKK